MNMEEQKRLAEFWLFPLFAIFIICSSTLTVSSEQTNMQVIENDGRITGVILGSDQIYSQNWSIEENEWYSIGLDCQYCTGSIIFNGTIIDSSSTYLTGKASGDGNIELTITTTTSESIGLSMIHNASDNFTTTRPAPSVIIDTIPGGLCDDIKDCIDISRGNLNSIPSGEYHSTDFITGVLNNGQAEYIVIDIESGDSMELSLVHSSSDLKIEVIQQNETFELLMNGNLTSSNQLTKNQIVGPGYWHFDNDGRAIIKVESQSQNTVWALQRTIFNSPPITILPTNSSSNLYGHHSKSVLIDVLDAQRLVLKTSSDGISVTVKQLMNGNWSDYGTIDLAVNLNSKIYVYPGTSAIKLDIFGPVFMIELSTEDYSDLSTGIEAPSLMPQSKETNNSSWPILNIDDSSYDGQFTLPIFDYSDVYKIEIEGWEDSIHFIKVIIEGDIADCEIELVEKDQDTWEDKDVKLRTISSGSIQAALEVGRGTHFLRISITNTSQYQNSWGEDISPKQYTITTQYELVDEGEEPWFPPDENAKKWGQVARWFLGAILLIPALFVFISYQRQNQFANSLVDKKKRLEWLRKRLDEGTSTPQKSRKFLKRALQSISTLEWDESCQIWGDYDLEHRTEGIALVAWKLDERLSKNKSSWPIIVGINILEGNWELAALRLDAPQGEPWSVTNVQPRFLTSGEEIFLDTMVKGNKIFLTLEIEGNSSCVDIEINGRVDGVPFAARIPKTLWRDAHNSEE